MQVLASLSILFNKLSFVLSKLSNNEYTKPCLLLNNATIEQHVRHIIELVQELNNGYYIGEVNYDNRKRNVAIETEVEYGIDLLKSLNISINKKDKEIELIVNYSNKEADFVKVKTSYFRELVANVEHCVHHMALIRVGINEVAKIELPSDFGVAISTIKHKNK